MKEASLSKTVVNYRLATWAGLAGPVLFVVIVAIEGWLRPSYSHLANYVSALSLGPRGWVQITNFIIFGACLFLFARMVAAEFPEGKAARGGLLLTIVAFCYFFSGPFVMDPDGTPQNQMTTHGLVHGILGGIVFILMPVSIFVFLRRFRSDSKWQSLQSWTLILGIICAAGSILLTLTTKIPSLMATFADWDGLIQRTVIVPFMIWIFLFALEFYRRGETS